MSMPSIEVLEANHEFPCPYTFKVIGSPDDDFVAKTVANVRDELQMEVDPPYSTRSTQKGNHVAVTLDPECQSAQQVIAVYSRLSGMDGVVMMF